jgi:hypothetical protein
MALTDSNESLPLSIPAASPHKGLAQLPEIHAELLETAGPARFLRSAVSAGAGLTLLGGLALMFAGGAGLPQEFAWSLLLLAGVGAMLRSYIKSTAQAFDRTPLRESARDLRAILFYAGFAWGTGGFLLLGNDPVPIVGLCFAVLPSVLMAVLLKDRAAGLNFLLPVTILAALAILLKPWGDTVVSLVMLLVVQGSIAVGLVFSGRPRATIPAGFPPASHYADTAEAHLTLGSFSER